MEGVNYRVEEIEYPHTLKCIFGSGYQEQAFQLRDELNKDEEIFRVMAVISGKVFEVK